MLYNIKYTSLLLVEAHLFTTVHASDQAHHTTHPAAHYLVREATAGINTAEPNDKYNNQTQW